MFREINARLYRREWNTGVWLEKGAKLKMRGKYMICCYIKINAKDVNYKEIKCNEIEDE